MCIFHEHLDGVVDKFRQCRCLLPFVKYSKHARNDDTCRIEECTIYGLDSSNSFLINDMKRRWQESILEFLAVLYLEPFMWDMLATRRWDILDILKPSINVAMHGYVYISQSVIPINSQSIVCQASHIRWYSILFGQRGKNVIAAWFFKYLIPNSSTASVKMLGTVQSFHNTEVYYIDLCPQGSSFLIVI